MKGMISRTAVALAAALLSTVAVTPAMADITQVVTTTLNVNDIVAGLSGFTGGVQGAPPFSPPRR